MFTRIISLVLIGTLLLHTSCSMKKSVLDDSGKVITEAEINENIGLGYRVGCVIGGGIVSVVPAFIGGAFISAFICDGWWFNGYFDRCSSDTAESLAFGSMIMIEVVGITVSYCTGKYLDRQRAINKIRAKHREQRK